MKQEIDGKWVPFPGGCSSYWLPFSDQDTEESWMDLNTGLPIDYSNWASGQPNGRRTQNCAVVSSSNDKWGDDSCTAEEDKTCAICARSFQPILRLRGLCSSTTLEGDVFTPVNNGPEGGLSYL